MDTTAQPQAETTPNTTTPAPAAAAAPTAEPAKKPDTLVAPATQPAPAAEPPKPFLSVRYNHRTKDLSEEEARDLAQKGLGYDKSIERAMQQGRDAAIADQHIVWNGKEIKTEADLKAAMIERELQSKGLNADEIRKVMENHPDIMRAKEIMAKNRDAERNEAEEKDKDDFLSWFEAEYKRPFDAKADEVPKEVWELNKSGVPLAVAYQAVAVPKLLRAELDTLRKGAQTEKVNKENAASTTGSATGDGGAAEPEFYTRDQVKAMSREEEAKHHDKIAESMKHW